MSAPSRFGAVLGWLARWRDLMSLLTMLTVVFMALGNATGFGLITPTQQFQAVHRNIDALTTQMDTSISGLRSHMDTTVASLRRADSISLRDRVELRAGQGKIVLSMRVLAVDVCMRNNPRDRQLLQIPCADLLTGRRIDWP